MAHAESCRALRHPRAERPQPPGTRVGSAAGTGAKGSEAHPGIGIKALFKSSPVPSRR